MKKSIWLVCCMAFSALQTFATTFTVTNASDSGVGSLRQAILDANASPGADTIQFNIAGSGAHTVYLFTELPALTGPTTLDGTTQPGFAGSPIIELSGNNAGPSDNGLHLTGGNCTVRGLVINRFAGHGMLIESNGNNVIAGNYIGTDVSGTGTRSNGWDGILVRISPNTIGGTSLADRNLISGNGQYGIEIQGARLTSEPGNRIIGNLIGTDITGTTSLSNVLHGIVISPGASNIIGGTTIQERNVISGNGSIGIYVYDSHYGFNRIQGNYIGVSAYGTNRLANGASGVDVHESDRTYIGGTVAGAGNLISGNQGYGIYLDGMGLGCDTNFIQGNFIGTDVTGKLAISNRYDGIALEVSFICQIGGAAPGAGNLISGNGGDGISLGWDTENTTIQGNLIGCDVSGAGSLSNLGAGISLYGAWNNSIGGTSSGAGNVISANHGDGIYFDGTGASTIGDVIQGNFIGTDASGNNALGNTGNGIYLSYISSYGATNFIGGTSSSARNIISANKLNGIRFMNCGPGLQIQGNYIGTDVSGTRKLGNMGNGIFVDNSWTNTIGGTDSGAGNLISGNSNGVVISGSSALGNAIQGNLIGTQRDGLSALGNSACGVLITNSASLNTVGGSIPGAGNTIAFSGRDGVRICSGNRNTVRMNSLFSNGGLGIDLNGDGVTPNDSGDGDSGANNLLNYPVLTSATNYGGLTFLTGTLNSVPNSAFTLEFFSNHATDPTTYGEGQTFLGSTNIMTDGNGNASFSVLFSPAVPASGFISATSTDPGGSTSEFSQCIVVGKPELAFSPSAGKYQVSWTSLAAGFHLEWTDNLLPPTHWTTVTNAAVLTNGTYSVILNPAAGNHFYRLAQP